MKKERGLTLIELLVVVAIIAVLILILLLVTTTQVSRSRDSRRKADLEKIKIAFEDYYNDNGCYPDSDVLDDCNQSTFAPYLSFIPCDPITKEPYQYDPVEGDECGAYRVYAILEDKNDPIIEALGCHWIEGCGASVGNEYNYGISMGISVGLTNGTLPEPSVNPSSSPASPSATPTIYVYACDSSGICNKFESGNPILDSCPITFSGVDCDNLCGNEANQCTGF